MIPGSQLNIDQDLNFRLHAGDNLWGLNLVDRASQSVIHRLYLQNGLLKSYDGVTVKGIPYGTVASALDWGSPAGNNKLITLDSSGHIPLAVIPPSLILGGGGSSILSVNGQTGPIISLTTDDIPEGLFKYYSDSLVNANSNVNANTLARHTHSNSAELAQITSTHITFLNTSQIFTSLEKSKLSGIATNATANSSDSFLLNRANHTGSQLASTISDFNTAVANLLTVTASTAVYIDHTTPPVNGQALIWSTNKYIPSNVGSSVPTILNESSPQVTILNDAPSVGAQTWVITHTLNKRAETITYLPDGGGYKEVIAPVIKYPIGSETTIVRLEFSYYVTGLGIEISIE